jgi:primase-polymerase (primpol)-like protein
MIDANSIPADLTERDHWLLWRRERNTKVPYQITGYMASSTNPAHWSTFDSALAAWRRRPRAYAGLGFVFSEADPFCGIDLDDCLDRDGLPKPWARGIIARFSDSYMETSPSGNGIKIWCRAQPARSIGGVPVGDGQIEVYDRARFFAVTGQCFRGALLEVAEHQSDVDLLVAHLAPRSRRAVISPEGRIPHGRQHYTLVSLAGTLARRHVCTEGIEAALQAVNRYQCERPGAPENIHKIAVSAGKWVN